MEPLGRDMNNVDCSRLGKMLHLEIQKGEEAMKTFILKNISEGLSMHEDKNDGYKRVWPTDVKQHLLC